MRLTRRGQYVEREEMWIVGSCSERASERHQEETGSSPGSLGSSSLYRKRVVTYCQMSDY